MIIFLSLILIVCTPPSESIPLEVVVGVGNFTWFDNQCNCKSGADHGLEGNFTVGTVTKHFDIVFHGCGFPSIPAKVEQLEVDSWPSPYQLVIYIDVYMPTCINTNSALKESFVKKVSLSTNKLDTLYSEFIGADVQPNGEDTGDWLMVYFEAKCPDNYYGSDCRTWCPAPDYTNGQFYMCNAGTGQKECLAYFFGSSCDVYCKPVPKRYGCSSTGSKNCLNGYFGSECSVRCQATSSDHFTCDMETGQQICKAGWYGKNCTSDGSTFQTAFYVTLGLLLLLIVAIAVTIIFICCQRRVKKQVEKKHQPLARLPVINRPAAQQNVQPVIETRFNGPQSCQTVNLPPSSSIVQGYPSAVPVTPRYGQEPGSSWAPRGQSLANYEISNSNMESRPLAGVPGDRDSMEDYDRIPDPPKFPPPDPSDKELRR